MSQNTFLGLRHVALFVSKFEETVDFYVHLLNMHKEWQPDEDNVYLSSGSDNLALHRAASSFSKGPHQALDHIGFVLSTPEAVDFWHKRFQDYTVTALSAIKQHRDGAKSFYAKDPDGNTVQIIYHPPIAHAH